MTQTFAHDFQKMQQQPKFILGVSDVCLNTFPMYVKRRFVLGVGRKRETNFLRLTAGFTLQG